MNKQIIQSQSPYTLSLSNVDTGQFANNDVVLKCSGTGITVNVPAQAEINGTPNFYVSADPAGDVTVNLSGGDNIFIDGRAVDTFQVKKGQSSMFKPVGNGIWVLPAAG
jgi:hypothetical protein